MRITNSAPSVRSVRGVSPRTLLVASSCLALVLTACGSQLEPDEVVGVAGTTTTDGQGGLAGSDGLLAGGDLTDGGVIDPGTGVIDAGTVTSDPGGSSAAGGTDTGGGGGGGTSGGGGGGAVGGAKAASCDGFKNQVGITDKEIVIGNAADISGPVPGLFEASQDALKAFVAYFNATDDICGRKLRLVSYDGRTDASADQQVYTKACTEVFAMVGSMGAFDSGGAPVAEKCGLPDYRSAPVTNERNACKTCFGAQSVKTGEHQNAVADFILKNFGDAGQHAGALYINAGSAAQNGPPQADAMEQRGMHFDVVRGIDISEFNYAPYVQQLKDEKVEVVFWTGAFQQSVKLRQAMEQQGYTPKVYMRDPTDYHPDYVSSGGSAVDGTYIFTNFTPFEEANRNRELATYMNWLQQVRPGAPPTFFGVFSWSAALLFVKNAKALGGKLTRASLVEAARNTGKWTGNGMHSPQNVGIKRTGDCWRFLQLKSGRWVPVGGTKYLCTGTTIGDPAGP